MVTRQSARPPSPCQRASDAEPFFDIDAVREAEPVAVARPEEEGPGVKVKTRLFSLASSSATNRRPFR